MKSSDITKIIRILDQVVTIFNDENLSWKIKYDIIFDDANYDRVLKPLGIDLCGYYDPDTTYEDDTRAYVNWFYEYCRDNGLILYYNINKPNAWRLFEIKPKGIYD